MCLPFIFNGKQYGYGSCVKSTDWKNEYWCATKVNDKGQFIERDDCLMKKGEIILLSYLKVN